MKLGRRGKRLARTDRKVQARHRQWRRVISDPPRCLGRARDRSHFDCGLTRCVVCNPPESKYDRAKEKARERSLSA